MNNADDQYLILLRHILDHGTDKPAAREGMPGTKSIFGYQFRHDLKYGFPLLTTKKMYWYGIVNELLWFLRGDTNIKYLVDNNINIWNEDAYNYYVKLMKNHYPDSPHLIHNIETFITYCINEIPCTNLQHIKYKYGDCGYQYGKVWRKWDAPTWCEASSGPFEGPTESLYLPGEIDQIKNSIDRLKNNAESRRHIVTAIDPAHEDDLALYWCHSMFQFNCRPLTSIERKQYSNRYDLFIRNEGIDSEEELDKINAPKYYLDCQLYQRSADVFLGVPFNIASYALLTMMIAKICNMIPGEFIHIFGDVHIYNNHIDAVKEQLSRQPKNTPSLEFSWMFNDVTEKYNNGSLTLNEYFESITGADFNLKNYNYHPAIKAELSTGLIK